MTLHDARGEALSTDEGAVLAIYEHSLDLFNSMRMDPVATLQPALDMDPDFISGHLLMAGLMLSAIDAQALPQARDSLAAASASRREATRRERSLLAALQPWAEGDMGRANRLLDRHLVDHPRDLFALQLTHMADLVLGQPTLLRDRVGRVLSYWSQEDVGYGYVLGMHAFGLEECNEYARAEEAAAAALERNPFDAWAVHAQAHVYEMQGHAEEGIRWLTEGNTHWQQDNMLAVHNWWHLALQHLRAGDADSALAVYDRVMVPGDNSMALDLVDGSALLWRLKLLGVDVGDRWQALAARWRAWALPGWSTFNDTHALLAQIGAGSAEGVAGLRRAMGAVNADAAPAPWWRQASSAAAAMEAFGDARYDDCARELLPLLHSSLGFGGSQAQRSILHLTTCEAARRAGDRALHEALSTESAARLPTARASATAAPRARLKAA